MATVKSITAKIERRNAKLAELTAERDSLLNEIRALQATKTTRYDEYKANVRQGDIYGQLAPINKAIDKLHRELRALQSELASLS